MPKVSPHALGQLLHFREEVGGKHDETAARRVLAPSVTVLVVSGSGHLDPGHLEIGAMIWRRVWIIGGQKAALHAVGHDVTGDVTDEPASPELEEGLSVDRVVDGLADMNVVKRGQG